MGSRTTTSCARACGRASRLTLATLAPFLLLFHACCCRRRATGTPGRYARATGLTRYGRGRDRRRLARARQPPFSNRAWPMTSGACRRCEPGSARKKLKDLERARAQIETHPGRESRGRARRVAGRCRDSGTPASPRGARRCEPGARDSACSGARSGAARSADSRGQHGSAGKRRAGRGGRARAKRHRPTMSANSPPRPAGRSSGTLPIPMARSPSRTRKR